MKPSNHRYIAAWCAAAAAAVVLTALPRSAQADDQATGKVVWVDQKHNALLLECEDKGCAKIPGAKTGETFTFVIPANLKNAVGALKENQQVTVTYRPAQGGGYDLVAVK